MKIQNGIFRPAQVLAACAAAGFMLVFPAGVPARTYAQSMQAVQVQTEEGKPQEELPAEMQTEKEQVNFETEWASSGEEPAEAGDGVTVKNIRFARDLDDIFNALQKVNDRYYIDYMTDGALYLEAEEALEDTGMVSSAAVNAAAAAGTSEDYSQTNVRTEGVDEADIIKTDGKFLYILRDHTELVIVRAEGADMSAEGRTTVCSESTWNSPGARELFISGSRVFVITEEYVPDSGAEKDGYYGNDDRKTFLYTYDVSDPAAPVLTDTFRMDGSYRQARLKDGWLYLFSEWMPFIGTDVSDSVLLPEAGGKPLPVSEVIIPDILTDRAFLVAAALPLEDTGRCADAAAVISGAEQLYVSGEHIYAVNADYWSEDTRTEITSLRYRDGEMTGIAAGTVRGTVSDTFSVDEYEGNLRVLTTYFGTLRKSLKEVISGLLGMDYYDEDRWTRHNALFVLDEEMRCIGRIADIAEDEEIKAARFFGDTGYFVTFRNTDPLFTADLSDPKHPVITGELSLPGFSAYLHPFGEHTLLGIGYDADEYTGSITGLKLSLFDMSDPADVREIARKVIPGITWCPAAEDYKAVFADRARQLAGFWCSDRYLVFRPDGEEGFERVLLYDFLEDDLAGDSDYSQMRGLFIGSEFYLAGNSFVIAFDMEKGFAKDRVLKF